MRMSWDMMIWRHEINSRHKTADFLFVRKQTCNNNIMKWRNLLQIWMWDGWRSQCQQTCLQSGKSDSCVWRRFEEEACQDSEESLHWKDHGLQICMNIFQNYTSNLKLLNSIVVFNFSWPRQQQWMFLLMFCQSWQIIVLQTSNTNNWP